MAYKIAVASSDGIHVDLKFGETKKFLIYQVGDEISLIEERKVEEQDTNESSCSTAGCSNGGCGGNGGNGCNGSSSIVNKVSLIADCRCIVCKKVGFMAQKQFEKKAISVFDVECEIEDALEKITFYYDKIDNHKSFSRQ